MNGVSSRSEPIHARGLNLPEYPWDQMEPFSALAAKHRDGAIDLSIGTPIDSTPAPICDALRAAANAPGYPTAHGSAALRGAIVSWFARRRGVTGMDPSQVMPTIGSKEMIALLPLLLGIGKSDVVVRPTIAYPTYDMGARLAGATCVAADSLDELDDETRDRVRLVWINSPGNPTGKVQSAEQLRKSIRAARDLGAVVASDECYAELGWGCWDPARGGQRIPSALEPRVNGGSTEGILALYSLSKQSNLAGYRAAFIAGDKTIMASLIKSRKHAGMIVPAPIQEAMRAALLDDRHVAEQKDRYRARRALLKPALEDFGLRVDDSEAGLYLWATAGEDCWATVGRLAEQGLVVAPGVFYGSAGGKHVRIGVTATARSIERAVRRLQT